MKQFSFIFLVLCAVITLSACSGGGDNSDIDGEEYLAYNYAEVFVKKELKSPSTAEFPGTFEQPAHIKKLSYKKYYIDSWVDSQNSYGATIRTKFSCIIFFEGDEVKCEGLVFY